MSDLPLDRPAAHRWRSATDLVWAHFDDGEAWVVYNPASADVNLLTAPARLLLELIASDSGRNSPDLLEAFAAAVGRASDPEFAAATAEALSSLDRAGLIHPVRS